MKTIISDFFKKYPAMIPILVVPPAIAVLVCIALALDTNQCESYSQLQGVETVMDMGKCYVKMDDKFITVEMHQRFMVDEVLSGK